MQEIIGVRAGKRSFVRQPYRLCQCHSASIEQTLKRAPHHTHPLKSQK